MKVNLEDINKLKKMNKATITTTKAPYLEVQIRESPLQSDIE